MGNSVLYRWPDAAQFGRTVPKTKFYEHATVSGAVRDRFVTEVQRITWAYKLADSTIHLKGDESVPEIQVFVVDAKDDDVSDDVLRSIDNAVKYPILFEVNRQADGTDSTRMAAALKQVGQPRQAISEYFCTGWLDTTAERVPLPPAIDLPTLYSALLAPLLPVPARAGEQLSDAVDRVERARKIEREVASLKKRLRNEVQFNRKVELRRELRKSLAELEALTEAKEPTTQESQWTS